MWNPIHAIKAGAQLIDFNHAAMRVAHAPLYFLIGPFLGGNVANGRGEGVLIELVQAPPEIISALA